MFKIENSPEFEAQMAEWRKESETKKARGKRQLSKALKKWDDAGNGWLPMADMPFEALDDMYGLDGAVIVSDGTKRAVATVSRRFGTPMFWKTAPERVMRDGMFHLIGGEIDPREDLPKWWWKWELTNEFGSMTYAGGEETGKEEIDFVPTLWTFIPKPPRTEEKTDAKTE